MMEKMKLKELVKQFIPMNYWNTRRKASIIRQQGKVADFWAPILKAYYNGEIERYSLKPKKKLGTQKVIWQYLPSADFLRSAMKQRPLHFHILQ